MKTASALVLASMMATPALALAQAPEPPAPEIIRQSLDRTRVDPSRDFLLDPSSVAEGEADAGEGGELFTVREQSVQVASRKLQTVSEAPSIVSVLTHDELRSLGYVE
jgi:hypothetical protein